MLFLAGALYNKLLASKWSLNFTVKMPFEIVSVRHITLSA